MKFSTVALLVSALTVVEAHYKMTQLIVNGAKTGVWQHVRKTTNYQSNGPVTDVISSQMTCYQLAPGNEGATTYNVRAGDTVGFVVDGSIFHPGPLSFWLSKAPGNTKADQWDGSGTTWFKIYQDYPTVTGSGLTWPSQGLSAVNVKLPTCIENGEYLLRVEHIALHSASSVGGAQLYLSCAQLSISGGTGTAKPKMYSFPGSYVATDPGLMINIYYPVPTNYKPPLGDPLKC